MALAPRCCTMLGTRCTTSKTCCTLSKTCYNTVGKYDTVPAAMTTATAW